MTRRPALIALVFTIAALAGCGGGAATPRGAGSPAGDLESGLIVQLQGDASLKRSGWRDYAPALFGTPFRKGDLLRVDASARATVACADLALAELGSGVNGFPCTATGAAPLVYSGGLAAATRGDPGTGEFPLVISPRKTKLLDPRPLLRWTPVAGAASYAVNLQGTSWSTVVEGATELAYPAGAPALQPGTAYRLVVEANGRSSNEEASAGLGFTLLGEAGARRVRDSEAKIRALGLPDASALLLLANQYANAGLVAEAIGLLEAAGEPAESALARLLGDLYLAVGLNREAETRYQGALALSAQLNDTEGQASAYASLGRIYDLLGNREEAGTHLEQAALLYEKLGDAQTAAEMRTLRSR